MTKITIDAKLEAFKNETLNAVKTVITKEVTAIRNEQVSNSNEMLNKMEDMFKRAFQHKHLSMVNDPERLAFTKINFPFRANVIINIGSQSHKRTNEMVAIIEQTIAAIIENPDVYMPDSEHISSSNRTI